MSHATKPLRRTRHSEMPAPDLLEYRCDGPYVRADHVLALRAWPCFDEPVGNPDDHPSKG